MDAEATEPLAKVSATDRIRARLSPSRVVAGISTTVALVAVAALVVVVTGEERHEPTAAERPTPAVAEAAP